MISMPTFTEQTNAHLVQTKKEQFDKIKRLNNQEQLRELKTLIAECKDKIKSTQAITNAEDQQAFKQLLF